MVSEEDAIEYITQNLDSYTAKQLSALTKVINRVKQEQCEGCADAVIKKLRSIGFQIYNKGEVAIREACLNATGNSDEENYDESNRRDNF